MSINASWLRMFQLMRTETQPAISLQRTLALGVQDVMMTHQEAEALTRRPMIEPWNRRYSLSKNQRQFTKNPEHYMHLKDLFALLGGDVRTLDAFPNDRPDIQWNLSSPVPVDLHQSFDLAFDIGVLEHVADIFQALANVAQMVKVGGWAIFYTPLLAPICTSMFHPNPPFYWDNLAANGFGNFSAYLNWMPEGDQRSDIKTIWLEYRYNDNPLVPRAGFYTVLWFMARKQRHVEQFKPALQGFYEEWHATDTQRVYPETGRVSDRIRHKIARRLLPQRPIPTRSVVGSPARIQLYL